MKKLLLLVGLVVFLTPMVVSSEENDLDNYHCISTPKPSFGSDKTIYCFCMGLGKNFKGKAYSSKVVESGINNFCDPDEIKINLGTYLAFKGRYIFKSKKLEPIEGQKLIITKKEIKSWLKESKNKPKTISNKKIVKKELSWLEKKKQEEKNLRLKNIILACEDLGLESSFREHNECTLLFESGGPQAWVGDTRYSISEISFCEKIITSNIVDKNIYECLDFFVENWKLQNIPIPPLTEANRQKAIKEKELTLGRKLNFHEQTCMSSISMSGEISISERCMEQFKMEQLIARQQDSSKEPTEEEKQQAMAQPNASSNPTWMYTAGGIGYWNYGNGFGWAPPNPIRDKIISRLSISNKAKRMLMTGSKGKTIFFAP